MGKTIASPPSAAHGTPKTARQPSRRHILRACAKHANHAHFLPVRKLSRQTFSGDEGARSEDILRVVRHLARWVVRVRVMKTSPARAAGGGKCSAAAHTCTGLATCVGKDYVIVSVPSHAVRDKFEVKPVCVWQLCFNVRYMISDYYFLSPYNSTSSEQKI